MNIRGIFNEIANESSTNEKMNILEKYNTNALLIRVLYLANSKRVKFYIKQIPEYVSSENSVAIDLQEKILSEAIDKLGVLSDRILTGNAGISHLKNILEECDIDSAYIIERIIEKDCKIGMGTRNINKVFPNLIEKTGYMGCKAYSKKGVEKLLATGTCYSQEKLDGRFINIIIQGGEVSAESRQGEPTILDEPQFMKELEGLSDCVLNGELVMEGIERYESNGIISSLITIATKKLNGNDITKELTKFEAKHMSYRDALDLIRVITWDMLTIDEYFTRKCKRPYENRLAELSSVVSGFDTLSIAETREVNTIEEVMTHFEEILLRNGEGTILKSKDGVWVDSKPSYQIKIKKEINLDLRIVGFNYGTGKNSNLISSLNVQSEEGLLKTSPTGMTEDEMRYVTENHNDLMSKILEVKCSGISQDVDGNYSVLHPVYKFIRDDKNIANTLEECIEINESTSLL